MVDASALDGEIDGNFVLVEGHLEVLLSLDGVGDLDSDFGGSLIPAVLELGLLAFVEVGNPQINDFALGLGLLFGLSDFGKQLSTHG